jgi:tetratricopeptide (TPR) repeat protein
MEMARARRRLGDIHVWLGDYEAAEREFKRGLALGEELLKDDSQNLAYRNLVAEAYFFLGTLRAHRQQVQAELDLNQALTRWESIEPTSPGNVVAQARVLHQLGLLCGREGRRNEEDQCLRQALARLESLSSRNLATPSHRLLLADVLHSLAKCCEHRGRPEEGEQHLRRAADLIVKEYRENPVPSVHIRLASAYSNLAQNLARSEQTNRDAGIFYAKSILISERLVEEFPRAWPCQSELAAASDSYGYWLLNHGRIDEAVLAHRRAVKLWLALVARDASNVDYRRRLGAARHKLSLALSAGGDLAEARANLLVAINDEAAVLQAGSQDAKAIDFLQQHGTLLVRLMREMNDAAAVEPFLARQLALFDKLAAAAQPATSELRLAVWRSRRQLGQFLSQQGRLDEAEVLFLPSVEAARLVQADDEPAYRCELGKSLNGLARIRLRQRRFAETVELLESAISLHQAGAADSINDRVERNQLYAYHELLSEALVLMGDYLQAACVADQASLDFSDRLPHVRWASVWARCCALARDDARLDEEERQALLRAYGDKAVALLRLARQENEAKLADLATRSEFTSLHARQDFHELLSGLGQKLP